MREERAVPWSFQRDFLKTRQDSLPLAPTYAKPASSDGLESDFVASDVRLTFTKG